MKQPLFASHTSLKNSYGSRTLETPKIGVSEQSEYASNVYFVMTTNKISDTIKETELIDNSSSELAQFAYQSTEAHSCVYYPDTSRAYVPILTISQTGIDFLAISTQNSHNHSPNAYCNQLSNIYAKSGIIPNNVKECRLNRISENNAYSVVSIGLGVLSDIIIMHRKRDNVVSVITSKGYSNTDTCKSILKDIVNNDYAGKNGLDLPRALSDLLSPESDVEVYDNRAMLPTTHNGACGGATRNNIIDFANLVAIYPNSTLDELIAKKSLGIHHPNEKTSVKIHEHMNKITSSNIQANLFSQVKVAVEYQCSVTLNDGIIENNPLTSGLFLVSNIVDIEKTQLVWDSLRDYGSKV